MKIVKAVPGDAGGYRCEVTAKDKCDSSTFEVSVEGECKWPTKTVSISLSTVVLIQSSNKCVLSAISRDIAAHQEEQADILSAFKRA